MIRSLSVRTRYKSELSCWRRKPRYLENIIRDRASRQQSPDTVRRVPAQNYCTAIVELRGDQPADVQSEAGCTLMPQLKPAASAPSDLLVSFAAKRHWLGQNALCHAQAKPGGTAGSDRQSSCSLVLSELGFPLYLTWWHHALHCHR